MAVSTASTPTSKYSRVHLADEVGAGEHEVLVAALERGAAEVVGAEVLVLDPGAERAVEDEDALAQERRGNRTFAPGYRSGFALRPVIRSLRRCRGCEPRCAA